MSRTIAALYDSRAEAEFARGRLVSRVKAKSPRIIAKDTLGALDVLDMATEEKDSYRQKLSLGGHLVVAEAPAGVDAERILELLEEAVGHADRRAEQLWGDEEGVRVELPAQDERDGKPVSEKLRHGIETSREESPPPPKPQANDRARRERTTASATDDARLLRPDVREPQSEPGARVRSVTREVPVEEQVTLKDEVITVESRSSGRSLSDDEVDAGGLFQERVIEVVAMREVPVVTKVAVVREEVLVRKTVKERTDTIRETVRQTAVEVEDVSESEGVFFGQRGNSPNRRSRG